MQFSYDPHSKYPPLESLYYPHNPSTGLIWAPPPLPARIRNGGRQIKRMIWAPGIQLKKNRNAFPHHRGSWTSNNLEINRNALNISIFRIGHPENFFKSSPFSPYEIPPN